MVLYNISRAAESSDNVLTKNLWVWWQPQLLTLIYTTIILIVLSLVVYFKVKKVKPYQAPTGIAFLAEQYVSVFDNEFYGLSNGKIDRVGPYIFTLISFLLVGNTAAVISLEPVVTSYSVSLTLGLITWIGIYVFGIMHKKLSFFKKYINPIELVGQFSPLISISFRIFGNILGGGILVYLIYIFTGYIWSFIPIIGEVNLLGMVIAPWFHMYFDLFEAMVQSYVFALLTCIYWSQEVEDEASEAKEDVNILEVQPNQVLANNA